MVDGFQQEKESLLLKGEGQASLLSQLIALIEIHDGIFSGGGGS